MLQTPNHVVKFNMNRPSLLHTKFGIYMTSTMLPAGTNVYVPPRVEDIRDRGYCGVVKSLNATSRRYIITKSDDAGVVEKVEVAQSMVLRFFRVRDQQYPTAGIEGEVSCINRETQSLPMNDRPIHGSVEGCAVDSLRKPMYYLVGLCEMCCESGSSTMWFLADDVSAGYKNHGIGQDPTNTCFNAVSTLPSVAAPFAVSTLSSDASTSVSSVNESIQDNVQRPFTANADAEIVRQRAVKFDFKHDAPKTKVIFAQLVTDVPWLYSRCARKCIWQKHLHQLFQTENATELRAHKDATKSFSAWAAAICRARKIWRLQESQDHGEVKENDADDDVSNMWATRILGDEKVTSSSVARRHGINK